MDDFAERIKATLENPNSDPWFPELTNELVERTWAQLYGHYGLTTNNYGTARVLSRTISAPREIVTSLNTLPSTGASAIEIEAVQQRWSDVYRKAGISFYSPEEIFNPSILPCIEGALDIINQVPDLLRTITALVRSLHIIRPQDSDYDLSFSEPHVPFSVFISVPTSRIANDCFRVAESLVHEAMHLQLTLLEKVITLVGSETTNYYSPWRKQYRGARSVLHALYVFAVIERFLARTESAAEGLVAQYIGARRRQIREQVSQIKSFRNCSDLSMEGARLAEILTRSATNTISQKNDERCLEW